MSFKRDGDDTALLNNLRKHRIDELLTVHIPDDEAILLSNGRYSCSVCSYRPIFDTISVLAIHRKGKKHLNSLAKRLKTQNDRRLKSEPELAPIPVNAIYKSCTKTLKKAKPTPYSRKQTVILKETVIEKPANKPSNVSTKSIINNYVSTIQKKKDFTAFVEKSRSGLSLPSSSSTTITNYQPKPIIPSQKKMQCEPKNDKRLEILSQLSLREKGWIKNDDGTWDKEDGVEFDSDEDVPLDVN